MEQVNCGYRLVIVLAGEVQIAYFRDVKSAHEFINLFDSKKVLNWHIRDLVHCGKIVLSKYAK